MLAILDTVPSASSLSFTPAPLILVSLKFPKPSPPAATPAMKFRSDQVAADGDRADLCVGVSRRKRDIVARENLRVIDAAADGDFADRHVALRGGPKARLAASGDDGNPLGEPWNAVPHQAAADGDRADVVVGADRAALKGIGACRLGDDRAADEDTHDFGRPECSPKCRRCRRGHHRQSSPGRGWSDRGFRRCCFLEPPMSDPPMVDAGDAVAIDHPVERRGEIAVHIAADLHRSDRAGAEDFAGVEIRAAMSEPPMVTLVIWPPLVVWMNPDSLPPPSTFRRMKTPPSFPPLENLGGLIACEAGERAFDRDRTHVAAAGDARFEVIGTDAGNRAADHHARDFPPALKWCRYSVAMPNTSRPIFTGPRSRATEDDSRALNRDCRGPSRRSSRMAISLVRADEAAGEDESHKVGSAADKITTGFLREPMLLPVMLPPALVPSTEPPMVTPAILPSAAISPRPELAAEQGRRQFSRTRCRHWNRSGCR
jgi:hypothetical protein